MITPFSPKHPANPEHFVNRVEIIEAFTNKGFLTIFDKDNFFEKCMERVRKNMRRWRGY